MRKHQLASNIKVGLRWDGKTITQGWFISVCKTQTFDKYNQDFEDKLVN